jgi:hypothetical protein
VFSEEVFVVKVLWDRAGLRICSNRLKGHGSDFFQGDGMMRGFRGSFAPAKRGMAGDQNGREMQRIQLREKPHESAFRVGLIVRSNLRCTKRFGDGRGAVKIIGMGGAEARNLALRLRPSSCGARMCVRDTSDACEGTIEKKVSWKVRRWPESALDNIAIESATWSPDTPADTMAL